MKGVTRNFSTATLCKCFKMWIEREHQASSRDLDKYVQKGIDSPHGFEIFIHNQTRFIPTSNSTGYKFKSKQPCIFSSSAKFTSFSKYERHIRNISTQRVTRSLTHFSNDTLA